MPPVEVLIAKPAVELKLPPVVPLNVTDAPETDLQYGLPAYEIVAERAVVIVTEQVAVAAEQPPAAGILYVTVYVPAVLVDGVMAPVEPSIVRPAVEL